MYEIVHDPAVKTLLMQNELGERWGKWMVTPQEFYLEIQPMRLVIGQGLLKMIVDNQVEDEKEFRFDNWMNENNQKKMIVSQVDIGRGIITDIWYKEIV